MPKIVTERIIDRPILGAGGAAAYGASGRSSVGGIGRVPVGGLKEDDIRDIINDAIRDAINDGTIPTPEEPTPTPTSASPVTRTVDDIIRDTVGPINVTAGSSSFTAKIPSTVEVGDMLLFVVASRTVYDETDIPSGSPYYPNGINLQGTPDGLPDGWDGFFGASTYTWFGTGFPQELRSMTINSLWKEAAEADIGANVTFGFYLAQTDAIYYLLVLNGDYILASDEEGDWNIGYNEAYGEEDTDPDYRTGGQMIAGESHLYIDNIGLLRNYSFVLAYAVTESAYTVTPQASWRKLTDSASTAGRIGLYVAIKKYSTAVDTDRIRGYVSNPDMFFAAAAAEITQVDAPL